MEKKMIVRCPKCKFKTWVGAGEDAPDKSPECDGKLVADSKKSSVKPTGKPAPKKPKTPKTPA